ncbi:hypothetical protein J8L06_09960 [Bacteroides fragilis]|nr:hypothetical protein [Bacteroides fragilis]
MPVCDKPTGGKTRCDTLIIRRIIYRYFDIPLRRGSGKTAVQPDERTLKRVDD